MATQQHLRQSANSESTSLLDEAGQSDWDLMGVRDEAIDRCKFGFKDFQVLVKFHPE